MIKCTACGTNNLDGSQFCDECGNSLQTENKGEVTSNRPISSDSQKFQLASVTSVGIPLIIEEPKVTNLAPAQNKNPEPAAKQVKAKLVIERGSSVGTEFPITNEESNIGRWDADNGIFPDIDLDVHDPEAKVSRRHARIIFENGGYLIEDLGSTNGTFVNRGRRLLPGTPHRLSDGDEIIVGKTFLRFHLTA
jgi:hypothetical protein